MAWGMELVYTGQERVPRPPLSSGPLFCVENFILSGLKTAEGIKGSFQKGHPLLGDGYTLPDRQDSHKVDY